MRFLRKSLQKKWITRHPLTAMLSMVLIALACATGVFAYKSSVASARLVDEARKDALVAIWSGDRSNAEKKIEEANNEGITEGWSHLLNGLLKLHHGEP